jgi:iron complex transport system substrate-binding protein
MHGKMGSVRIVSLLPAATEILWALGLGDRVVGRSHECDYPPEVRTRPVVVRSTIDPHRASAEIDRAVAEAVRSGRSLYIVDRATLEALRPDLVVTQEVCHVCAASGQDLCDLQDVVPGIRTVTLGATSLNGVMEDILRLGEAAQVPERARALVAALEEEIREIATRAQLLHARPRVACVEWLDPPYVAGHWVPEMVQLSGADDVLGEPGRPSRRTTWTAVARCDPDIVILMPCGFSIQETRARLGELDPAFWDLRAVRDGRAYLVDANAHFSRPGPRLVEGLRTLAALFHPEAFGPEAAPIFAQVLGPRPVEATP